MINKKYKRSILLLKFNEDDKPNVPIVTTTGNARVRKQSIICNPKEYDFTDPIIFNVNYSNLVSNKCILKTNQIRNRQCINKAVFE